MEVRIVEDVQTEPIPLSLVKDFCRIDPDYTGEDDTLTLLQATARELLEQFLNLSLAPKTIEIQYRGGYLQLPYGPHSEIVSVKTPTGDDIDSTAYKVWGMDFKSIDTNGGGFEYFYPITGGAIINPVGGFNDSGANIIVNVGYTSENLKSGLKLLILRLVDYMYQNRGSIVVSLPEDIKTDASIYSHNSVL